MMHEAMFYEVEGDKLRCNLCPHRCLINKGKTGICKVRKNIDGKLYSLVYARALSRQIDPIEKKPLFHFFPGEKTYSFCTAGCNMQCSFCQNWQISQAPRQGIIPGSEMEPKDLVEDAIKTGSKIISMTYNEPTIFFEYCYDVSKLAKKKGLKTVFVSNGFIEKKPIRKISKYLDAINIDLKSFSEDFYRKICKARLSPVLETIKEYYEKEVMVEITTLIIPGENDSDEELKNIAGFIASIGKDIPWHISRFHPDYNMTDKEMTEQESLDRAYEIGKKAGLKHIYTGNIGHTEKENTYCPGCNSLLIERDWFSVRKNSIKDGKCPVCGQKIYGTFY